MAAGAFVLPADGGGMLIGAPRSAQGIGAALLPPAATSLVTALFQGPARHRALGVRAAAGGAGAAFGALLGGIHRPRPRGAEGSWPRPAGQRRRDPAGPGPTGRFPG
ncbi:hypothetical protein [Streptomyces sp. NBC_01233]|uniref:hypothetical protein n=1 Tax=Streptomyces sp. NBC_01233 TaxID=2903787 RepID=UPI002E15E710